jgi:ubiquinone/menaquinone biosynthesis C-methylase UbiE
MEHYFEANRRRWNEMVAAHIKTGGYDVEGFLNGKSTLHSVELEGLGDVTGKTLLHLQCYFGMDTLSWARLGAKVTGVDLSDKAIKMARTLSVKTGLHAEFINSNIYDLSKHLDREFDIVYTSYGALCWLNDIKQWGRIISRYLKSGGTFYMAEFHPFAWIFDENLPNDLRIKYSYWEKEEPDRDESEAAYSAKGYSMKNKESYSWPHSLSEIMGALWNAGLEIVDFQEYPFSVDESQFPVMYRDHEGYWRVKGDPIPLMYSLKAGKQRNYSK